MFRGHYERLSLVSRLRNHGRREWADAVLLLVSTRRRARRAGGWQAADPSQGLWSRTLSGSHAASREIQGSPCLTTVRCPRESTRSTLGRWRASVVIIRRATRSRASIRRTTRSSPPSPPRPGQPRTTRTSTRGAAGHRTPLSGGKMKLRKPWRWELIENDFGHSWAWRFQWPFADKRKASP